MEELNPSLSSAIRFELDLNLHASLSSSEEQLPNLRRLAFVNSTLVRWDPALTCASRSDEAATDSSSF